MSICLRTERLTRSHDGVLAVADFSHEFAAGEITSIVGPSGSGKSTTLGMIAGLTSPDSGRVFVDEVDITAVPPEARDFGMVFQSYALFPHLTVARNVEFGLRVRGISRAERRRRAEECLALLHIDRLAERRPHQLSGGEQQRVALARALAIRPRALLMDEPLSALDAKLRDSLRAELHRLLGDLGITTIYVTHDQVEAMSLGHELIVMNEGRIEQRGRPFDVYSRPANPFVAGFLGVANMLEGECVERDGERSLRLSFSQLPVRPDVPLGPCWVILRPEDVEVVGSNPSAHFQAEVEHATFLGNLIRLQLRTGDTTLTADVPNDARTPARGALGLRIKTDKLSILER